MPKRVTMTEEQIKKANNYTRQWNLRNKEYAKNYRRKYRLEHPEIVEKRNEYVKKWRIEHREQVAKKSREWAKRNPEKIKARYHKYKVTGKDKIKQNNMNRSALKKGVTGKLSKNIIKELLIIQNNKCVYCEIDFSTTLYCIDHILPLIRGGKNEDSNIQLTCLSCNCSKGRKTHEEFLIYRTKNSPLQSCHSI